MNGRDLHDEPPASNPQAREHRGDQDVERPPDDSPLDDHDERTTEYGAQGSRDPGRDAARTPPAVSDAPEE